MLSSIINLLIKAQGSDSPTNNQAYRDVMVPWLGHLLVYMGIGTVVIRMIDQKYKLQSTAVPVAHSLDRIDENLNLREDHIAKLTAVRLKFWQSKMGDIVIEERACKNAKRMRF